MNKHNGKYYLQYAAPGTQFNVYADGVYIGETPLGPFEYKGVILQKMNSGTNHHSIAMYKGKWYMFYHNSDLYYDNHPELEQKFGWGHPGSLHPFRRSICVDKLFYNQDGTIKEVVPTKEGIQRIN